MALDGIFGKAAEKAKEIVMKPLERIDKYKEGVQQVIDSSPESARKFVQEAANTNFAVFPNVWADSVAEKVKSPEDRAAMLKAMDRLIHLDDILTVFQTGAMAPASVRKMRESLEARFNRGE